MADFELTLSAPSEILYQAMGGRVPTVIDVDWLFDRIYFVEDNQVGTECTKLTLTLITMW